MFSTVLWSSVYVPLTLFFFWSIDHGLLYYPWMACSYTRCTLDRIMEMNIGLKGFQATEISVQKHKQPPCTKQILAILHATRNGHHRVVRSCTIYLPAGCYGHHLNSGAVLRSSWSRRGDSACKHDLARCGPRSHQILPYVPGTWSCLACPEHLRLSHSTPFSEIPGSLFTVQIHQNLPKPCNLGWLHLESHLTYLPGDKPTWPSQPVTGLLLPRCLSQVLQPTRISWDLLDLEFGV